jgi:hypothetical protein
MTFKPGDEVMIQCETGQGAFPTEVLVTFETVDGPISGFVRRENVVQRDTGDIGYLKGVVKDVSQDIVTVLVRGSFFTTTGIAALRRDWADSHVQVANAA